MGRRVVVTGMGAITPNGNNARDFWKSIKAGENGIGPLTKFDNSRIDVRVAAEVRGFDPESYIDKKELKRMDLYCQYAVVASLMAVEDAALDTSEIDRNRFGVIIGAGIGGISTFEKQYDNLKEKGPSRVSPLFIPMMIPNMASGMVSIATGAKGICECVVTACSSGNNAIGNAYKSILNNEMDVMICGGTEAAITELALAGFSNMKAVTTSEDPNRASIPFDKERDGFVMGEGAGIMVIEDYDHAVARGARIIAEIKGFASTSDAFHMTAPAENGEGGARSMQGALDDAGLMPEDIDYINAHGTSTPLNDKNETAAIKTVFGDHAYKVAVSSTKSMTGHLLGAAGGIEGIICCMAIQEQFIPATINYRVADEECDLDYTPGVGRQRKVDYALSNSLGFGGHNSTIIFGKV
ncbi:MAG TPA: beta-ketoacyl-ACP synthase II [Clostridia bacterium]|nr:beta-ketoacyl-ACP synthase II [Clostridia bacterium]HPQ46247.1 beta-ketoacyl-ACP synthase II [Clostridia bacterium]HRX42702.1 beta-ketoacyl-ACP synthase II [Clostridia bacterium]